MNFIEFLQQYKETPHNAKIFEKNFQALLKSSKENDSLLLCFQNLLEHRMPFEYLKRLIEYDEKGKEDILNDSNTFKWACAFGNPYLIMYLNDKVKNHNLAGSINATIINYRWDNLKALEMLGYEKEMYTEPNFCQAISRADQTGCSLSIVEYFLNNIEKFKPFTLYVYNQLKEKNWVGKICEEEYTTTLQYLLDLKLDNLEKQVCNYTDDIMSMALYSNKVKVLDVVMNSYLKDKFVDSYTKIKNKNIKDNIQLDRNNYLQNIIEKYPELIKHEDIQLFMMNETSLTIDKFICEKRKLTKTEITKAYIALSEDPTCFRKLCEITPDYKVVRLPLGEVIKIVNNLYQAYKDMDQEIDYTYESEYMKFNRDNVLNHKHFKEYFVAVHDLIEDRYMLGLLEKEQMKKDFDMKYPEKSNKKTKQMKI